jgi:hypothetical protein
VSYNCSVSFVLETFTHDTSAVKRRSAEVIGTEFNQPDFIRLIRLFLHEQLHADSVSNLSSGSNISDGNLPEFKGRGTIFIHNSAVAIFFAPSDISGVEGMRREHIRATPTWRKGPARYDCVFINTDADQSGMRGLDVARVRLFFSFMYQGIKYPCALIRWFSRVGDEPDVDTGMWLVQPDSDANGPPTMSIVHVDTIVRAAHLIGVYGDQFLPPGITFHNSLDVFDTFYVNKYIDHHAFEIAV